PIEKNLPSALTLNEKHRTLNKKDAVLTDNDPVLLNRQHWLPVQILDIILSLNLKAANDRYITTNTEI
ncbi:MAG: hypothetical protein U9R19_14280, partial [Bacteroidota bacterium]|nr:hypothetical protein [Bacteroidota bacterium]